MFSFDLDDDAPAVIEEYKQIFDQPTVQMVARAESPVDPLIITSTVQSNQEKPSKDDGSIVLYSKPLSRAKEDAEMKKAISHFSETTLSTFPFPELEIKQSSLLAFYLYEWYRLWDVPAAALKPHMGEPWNPCSNPVTLDEVNAPLLKEYPYVVSTKTNGMRVQVMVTRHPATQCTSVLMVDRTMAMYDVGSRLMGLGAKEMEAGCVLDGELVERTDGKWGFVLFDVVAHRGRVIRKMQSLQDRLSAVWDWYMGLENSVLPNGYEFVWMTKTMFMIREPRAIDMVLNEEKRPYATDGLVFTPLLFSIPFETSPFLFKWKPDELHSIDFRLVGHPPNEKRAKWGLELKYKYQTKERNLLQGFWFIGYMFGLGSVGLADSPALQSILARWAADQEGELSCICECKLDVFDLEKEKMVWSVVRERTDKSDPNSELTLIGTLKTIMFPLSLDKLKAVCNQVGAV